MPLDPNIALQGQVANPFQSMGQAIGAASGLAQLANTRQQNELMQAETQNLNQTAQYNSQLQNERNVYQAAMQDKTSPFYNADGTIDPNKFQVWGNQNTPLLNSQFGGAMLKQNQAINEYHSTVANMATKDHDVLNNTMSSWIKPDGTLAVTPLDAIKQIEQARSQLTGVGKGFADQAQDFILNNKDNPQLLAQGIAQFARTTTGAQQQGADRRASNTFINTGGATVPVSNTGEYGTAPGTQTGAGVTNTLSPEGAATRVPVMVNGVPGTVSQGSLASGGNSPFGSGRMGAQPGQNPSFIASGAPMGASADTDWMKKDYQGVVDQASTAQQRIGLYNNVQQLSKQALTGPQDRLNYANSVLALIGVKPSQDLNDATALLNKNSAMIQQAFGGNTDAARAVIAHMTPGSAMPDKANQEIAAYGKANAQMQQFQQSYLKDASNGTNAGTYKDRKSDLAMVSDPRLWQFQNMAQDDRVNYLRAMSPAQQQQFGALYKKANALGAFQ